MTEQPQDPLGDLFKAMAKKPGLAPSRKGSKYCANADGGRNGSVASGGTIEYCTCDRCF